MTFDRTNRWTLNKNQRKIAETHADYTGKINIEGRDYWLNGWVEDSANGKFISLSIKPEDMTTEHADAWKEGWRDRDQEIAGKPAMAEGAAA